MIKGLVIPSFVDGNEWAACFGLSWADMLLFDQAKSAKMMRDGGMFLREVAGTMGVAAARNSIVNAFLTQTDAEWLFMVDTDMGFEPDTVDRMVASAELNNADILGGLCFALKRKDPRVRETSLHAQRYKIVPTLYRYAKLDNGEQGFRTIMNYTRNAYQVVDGTGAACLLMRRVALERIGPDPFRPMLVRGANPDGTDREFSEDLSFCARAANARLVVGVDTAIKTTHYKMGLFLDEETYRIERALAAASPIGNYGPGQPRPRAEVAP